jgi:serine protease Do
MRTSHHGNRMRTHRGHWPCGTLLIGWCLAGWLVAAIALPAHAETTLAEEEAFRAAVARVAPAVVRIEPAGMTGSGAAEPGGGAGPSTGLIVDPSGLILATTFAVPDDATSAVVVLPDGRRLAATPRGRDVARGIVLLETAALPAMAALEPVARRDLEPGQWAIAVGRGWTAAVPGVAVGVISAVHRGWGLAVQTDASVSPVNYGGPLVDIAGRVIGILVPLPADTAGMKVGTELYDAGIGFAIPLDEMLAELPRLKRGEMLRPGVLGIGYRSRDRINGEPVIGSVRQGSPAARAGVRPGDRIVAVDGRPVVRIAEARHRFVPRHAGDEIELTLERSGDEEAAKLVRHTVRATLVETLPPWRRAVVGMVAAASDDDAAAARVAWVLPGGPAAAAGVVAGDRVTSVAAVGSADVVEAPSPAILAGLLAGWEPGTRVRLGLDRDGATSVVEMDLAAIPSEVPDEGPPAETVAAGPGGPVDAAQVVKLEGAEIAEPPVAVLPPPTRGPLPVLIHLGPPRGAVAEAEAAVWKAAVASSGVAVILPGSSDPRQWSREDIPAVVRALQSLDARRRIDPARVAVAGSGAGGAFAWLLAERLGPACRGVAVTDAAIPRPVTIEPAEPGTARWILVGGREPRIEQDRDRLAKAGYPVGTLAVEADAGPPAAVLCRWVSLLGLL